ncbi:hypothetical protein GLOIN_2v1463696 [Rhizophagus clarus]|uniref:Transposase domain-containing protein n=1 Tax=Rhizophagus clarus TaxID=94130 RepID=A0A8H3LM52_9GLOM|nr:hypothetical protein GLOIN_2v1463696 [Rhizophagus clarus]
METSDNDEENEQLYMKMSDSEDLEKTDDDFGFENEENNNYENDLISDSQNESEFDNADNVNFNTDNEEVGIEPKIYDMYVNLCCAFVGVLENERKCKFCKEDRYYSDIFDGQIYKELLDDGYFPDPRDIAFTAFCDGLKQPQDFNSFLYPLIQKMKMLQDGISCYNGNKKENFTLRAHILTWTGDLSALSKVLCLTGHNSYSGKFYPKNDKRNSNNYTISSKTWVEIGEIMKKNRSNMPSDIRRSPRNIIKHSAGFKAVEWANWIILFSLPLLKGRLPQICINLRIVVI